MDAIVVCHEDSSLPGGVGHEVLVVVSLAEDIDRAHHVPAPRAQSLDDLLADVVVR
jgi:hypothetical protein